MSVTSLILTQANQQFVSGFSANRSMTKTDIINKALDLYRKYMLRKDIIEGFSNQSDEDVAQAMSDFDSYLKIIDTD